MHAAPISSPLTRGRIVVWGLLAARPFGGMTWQVLHYLEGLRRLGFDVWYVEDSDITVFRPSDWWPTSEYQGNVQFIDSHLGRIGLGERWVFRPSSASEECFGACGVEGLTRLYREADLVVNLCGSHKLRPDHDGIRRLAYLETDPVLLQIATSEGQQHVIEELDRYDVLFTYGENLGAPDCPVPLSRYRWLTTRPPVVLDWWRPAGPPEPGAALTTVANLTTQGKDIVWRGCSYRWRKDATFAAFETLPARSPLPLAMAVVGIDERQKAALRDQGWSIRCGTELSDPAVYRDYIRQSRGEFSVAKEQYTATRSGWFSDRSVCYLASGRPVILQETGYSKLIPAGEGLLPFHTPEEALTAIEQVASDYPLHAQAAGEIAAEYFRAEQVLGDLLDKAGLG